MATRASSAMIPAERRRRILELMRERGAISVGELGRLLGASAATIRRDLDDLSDSHQIARSYGGAALDGTQGTSFEPSVRHRLQSATDQKRRIAQVAVERVASGDTILLDSSTTVLEMARLLGRLRNLTVITNDIAIAALLLDNPAVKSLLVLGGTVRAGHTTLMGPPGDETLRAIRVDTTFLGVHAINERGLSDSTLDLARTKASMVAAARRSIVLADSLKLLTDSFASICPLDAITEIITDAHASSEARTMLAGHTVTVTYAS